MVQEMDVIKFYLFCLLTLRIVTYSTGTDGWYRIEEEKSLPWGIGGGPTLSMLLLPFIVCVRYMWLLANKRGETDNLEEKRSHQWEELLISEIDSTHTQMVGGGLKADKRTAFREQQHHQYGGAINQSSKPIRWANFGLSSHLFEWLHYLCSVWTRYWDLKEGHFDCTLIVIYYFYVVSIIVSHWLSHLVGAMKSNSLQEKYNINLRLWDLS